MNVSQLRDEANRARREAQSMRDQITRLNQDEIGHNAVGDADKAKYAQDQAAKLEEAVSREERNAAQAESHIVEMEQRVRDIERERSELEDEFNRRTKELDDEKTGLLGNSATFF